MATRSVSKTPPISQMLVPPLTPPSPDSDDSIETIVKRSLAPRLKPNNLDSLPETAQPGRMIPSRFVQVLPVAQIRSRQAGFLQ
jgi:hypothetical protein